MMTIETIIGGVVALIAAIIATYLGGKKVGKTETQAKADVAEAERIKRQAETKSDIESNHIKVAKDVQQENASLDDPTARDRLRNSKYHTDD